MSRRVSAVTVVGASDRADSTYDADTTTASVSAARARRMSVSRASPVRALTRTGSARKPEAAAIRSYSPGGTSVIANVPSARLVACRTRPAADRRLTVAPATGAPEGSRTRPWTTGDCARAGTTAGMSRSASVTREKADERRIQPPIGVTSHRRIRRGPP